MFEILVFFMSNLAQFNTLRNDNVVINCLVHLQEKQHGAKLHNQKEQTHEHSIYRTTDSILYTVSRNDDRLSEKVNPSLESIMYQPNRTVIGKSVVYTVDIPISQLKQPIKSKAIESVKKSSKSKSARYISSVNVSIENIGEEESVHSSDSFVRIKSVTPVKYKKVTRDDLELDPYTNDLDLEDEGYEVVNSDMCEGNRFNGDGVDGLSTERTEKSEDRVGLDVSVVKTKEEILSRRRSKEALVAVKSQTADWLLKNDGQSWVCSSGRPNWASTPNLKHKKNYIDDDLKKRRFKKDAGHSFDLLLGEDTENEQSDKLSSDMEKQSQNTVLSQHSLEGNYHILGSLPINRPHLRHLQGDSACSSMDESVDMSRASLIGSSCGVSEDHLNYLRLARLVNGPSPIMVSSLFYKTVT